MQCFYEVNGGDALLEGCAQRSVLETFTPDNLLNQGTIESRKTTYTRPGFKMVEIVYKRSDGPPRRTLKYLFVNGQEYRLRNHHPAPPR